MKKFLSILIMTAMLLAMLPATVFSAFAEEPTVITTADQLKDMTDGTYKLGNDIDLAGAELTDAFVSFKGTLDGDGYSIKNFTLKLAANKVSLFAQSGEMTIKNLTIGSKDVPVAVTGKPQDAAVENKVGILLSDMNANTSFENVHVYGNTASNGSQLGGFIGLANGESLTASFKNCTMNGQMVSAINKGNTGMAGFIGSVTGSCSVTFENCVNNAVITRTDANRDALAAGFIAFVNTDGTVSVKNCINNGEISSHIFAGGLFGYLFNGVTTVDGFWNKCDITASTNPDDSTTGGKGLFAGSVFGRKSADLTLENVLNSGDIIAEDNFNGAIGGHNSKGKLSVNNFVTYGRARYSTCAGAAPSPLINSFYYGTYGEAATGMTLLENNDAVYEKVNSAGFMEDFRKVYGNFDKSFMEMNNEPLDPNRKIPTELPSLVEDTPFTKYIPGYVLHHMDFSKVSSFADCGYFVTKDNIPTVFKVENGALMLDTENGNQVIVAFTGNGIPKNIADLTLSMEVSFSDIRGGYLAVISSLILNEDGSKNKIVDTAVRDGKTSGEFPLPDGCAYGPAEYENGKLKDSAKEKWAKIGQRLAAGEKMSFTFSYKDSQIDRIVISSGDVSVELISPNANNVRDMGSYLGFMIKDVQISVYDVKVVAGSLSDYTALTWPSNENDLVNAVSPSAVLPDDNGGITTGDQSGNTNTDTKEPAKPSDTTGTTEPPKKGGCASAVSGSLAVLAVFAAAGLMIKKKKHQ